MESYQYIEKYEDFFQDLIHELGEWDKEGYSNYPSTVSRPDVDEQVTNVTSRADCLEPFIPSSKEKIKFFFPNIDLKKHTDITNCSLNDLNLEDYSGLDDLFNSVESAVFNFQTYEYLKNNHPPFIVQFSLSQPKNIYDYEISEDEFTNDILSALKVFYIDTIFYKDFSIFDKLKEKNNKEIYLFIEQDIKNIPIEKLKKEFNQNNLNQNPVYQKLESLMLKQINDTFELSKYKLYFLSRRSDFLNTVHKEYVKTAKNLKHYKELWLSASRLQENDSNYFDIKNFNSLEEIDDKLTDLIENNKVRKYTKKYLGKYIKMANKDTFGYFEYFMQNKFEDDKIRQGLSKIKGISDVETLNNCLEKISKNGFGMDEIINEIEKQDASIIVNNDNMLAFSVDNYEASSKLGVNRWCISYSKNYYKDYLVKNIKPNEVRRHIFVYDHSKSPKNNDNFLGFTFGYLNDELRVKELFNKNNRNVRDNYLNDRLVSDEFKSELEKNVADYFNESKVLKKYFESVENPKLSEINRLSKNAAMMLSNETIIDGGLKSIKYSENDIKTFINNGLQNINNSKTGNIQIVLHCLNLFEYKSKKLDYIFEGVNLIDKFILMKKYKNVFQKSENNLNIKERKNLNSN